MTSRRPAAASSVEEGEKRKRRALEFDNFVEEDPQQLEVNMRKKRDELLQRWEERPGRTSRMDEIVLKKCDKLFTTEWLPAVEKQFGHPPAADARRFYGTSFFTHLTYENLSDYHRTFRIAALGAETAALKTALRDMQRNYTADEENHPGLMHD